MNQSNPQLDRLEKILSLVDENYAKPEEVAGMFEVIIKAIQDIKAQLEQQILNGDESCVNECEKLGYAIKDLEFRVEKAITEAKQSSMSDIKALANRLNDDIGRVRALIPTLPDLSYIDRKLSDIEAKIPKLPPPIDLDTGEEIVNKINDLPTDDERLKIDAKHIKNLPSPTVVHGVGGRRVIEIIAGSNITVDNSNFNYPVIASTGGGGLPFEPLSGDLGQDTFTWASSPNVIFVDGGQALRATQTNGSVNWTVSGSGPYTTVFTAGISPIDDIFAL